MEQQGLTSKRNTSLLIGCVGPTGLLLAGWGRDVLSSHRPGILETIGLGEASRQGRRRLVRPQVECQLIKCPPSCPSGPGWVPRQQFTSLIPNLLLRVQGRVSPSAVLCFHLYTFSMAQNIGILVKAASACLVIWHLWRRYQSRLVCCHRPATWSSHGKICAY